IEALLAPAAQPRWQPRAVLAAANDALHRRARLPGRRLLERVARADRVIKGRAPGDAWDELALLVADLAGREVLCGATTVDAGRIDG
ncbi:MAG: hypothetical protein RML32_11870, partial [Gammaproteobacteria bacterium]|nr:hypothetical protein [Gammaproteobacteria bacterium]